MIPTYEEIMLPFLQVLADEKEHSLTEAHDRLAKHFKLKERDVNKLLPSGQQPVFRNRIGWARTYLKKAGLLTSPKRAHFIITKRGADLLKENPKEITSSFLERYEEFVDFKTIKKERNSIKNSVKPENTETTEQTPEEALEFAYQQLKTELCNELLDTVKDCSPGFFEKLVVDLLIRMGYGGSRKDAGEALGKTGDGGIDGTIKEDKLGLDIIYIQAKRWESTVPLKEIRDFAGALMSKKAKKGIFITTSSFPKSAFEFVRAIEHKIILIDGEQLADLMFENSVGLTAIGSYDVKKIDMDYFE